MRRNGEKRREVNLGKSKATEDKENTENWWREEVEREGERQRATREEKW